MGLAASLVATSVDYQREECEHTLDFYMAGDRLGGGCCGRGLQVSW